MVAYQVLKVCDVNILVVFSSFFYFLTLCTLALHAAVSEIAGTQAGEAQSSSTAKEAEQSAKFEDPASTTDLDQVICA